MELPWIVYILTAFTFVVVVLTRFRVLREEPSTEHQPANRNLINVHTIVGVTAVATWTVFLISGIGKGMGDSLIGIVALGLYWVTSVAGFMIAARWMPAGGRHAQPVRSHTRRGVALSVLGHGGLFVSVCVMTFAYLKSAV